MATTLPTVDNVIGKVQPQRLPRVSVPAGAFQTPNAELDAMAKTVQDFALDRFGQVNEDEAQDLTNDLNRKRRTLLDGTADEKGYTSYENREALNRRKTVEADWKNYTDELQERASNGHVSRMLSKQISRQTELFQNAVTSHANAAQKAVGKQVHEAAVFEFTQNQISSARKYDVEGAAAKYNGEISAFRNKRADYYTLTEGLDGDKMRQMVKLDVSNMHKEVIQDLMIKNPAGAQKYFEIYRADIDRRIHDELMGPMQIKVRDQVALDDVKHYTDPAVVMTDNRPDIMTPDGARTAYAELQAKHAKDPEQLKVSEARLKVAIDREQNIRDDESEEHLLAATQKLMRDPGAPLSGPEVKSFLGITGGAALLLRMQTTKPPISETVSMKNFAAFSDIYAAQEKAGKVMTPGQYNAKYATLLNTTEYNKGLNLVNAWHTRFTKTAVSNADKAKAVSMLSDTKRVETAYLNSGLAKTNDKGVLNKESKFRLVALAKAVDLAAQEKATTLKRDLTTAEKDAVIDGIIAKRVFIDDAWGDTEAIAALVTEKRADGDRVYVPFANIDDADQTNLTQSLVAKGITWSSDQELRRILEEYAAAIARGVVFTNKFILKEQTRGSTDSVTTPILSGN